MEEIKKLFSFDKKVKRAEFIGVYLFGVLALSILMIPVQEILPEQMFGLAALIAVVAYFWVMAANFVGRAKDVGLKGYYALLILVPLVNIIFLLYLVFTPSK